MYKSFIIYTLVLFGVALFAILQGFDIIHLNIVPELEATLFIGGVIILLLVFTGIIGLKPLKELMRYLWVWRNYEATIFFLIHPYKPVDEAVKEGVKNFLPTKKRVKEFYDFLFSPYALVSSLLL